MNYKLYLFVILSVILYLNSEEKNPNAELAKKNENQTTEKGTGQEDQAKVEAAKKREAEEQEKEQAKNSYIDQKQAEDVAPENKMKDLDNKKRYNPSYNVLTDHNWNKHRGRHFKGNDELLYRFNWCTAYFMYNFKPLNNPYYLFRDWRCQIETHPEIKQNVPYWSHEHRNIPKGYKDYTGISLTEAYHTYAAGIYVRLASKNLAIDYQQDGSVNSLEDWQSYDDSALSVKVRPHDPDIAFVKRYEKLFNFSFEKKMTPVHGLWYCYSSYCSYNNGGTYTCGCRWYMNTKPYYRNHKPLQWGIIEEWEKLQFPISANAWRYRHEGDGQKVLGYDWYITNLMSIFTLNNRYVHIRSPYSISGRSMCLVDPQPKSGSATRDLYAMMCKDAAAVTDQREVWYIKYFYPAFWSPAAHVAILGQENNETPIIGPPSGGEKVTYMETINENSMRSKSNGLCIEIQKNQYANMSCGGMIRERTQSSRAVVIGNTPCKPATISEGAADGNPSFWWAEDDSKPSVEYATTKSYGYLKSVMIEFTSRVEEVSFWCYNDHKGRWYSVEYQKNVKETKVNLFSEYCTYFKITVEKYSTPCRETKGICIGLKKVRFTTDYAILKYKTCDNDPEKKVQRWFLEPAHRHRYSEQNNVLNEYQREMTRSVEGVKKIITFYKKINKLYQSFEPVFGDDSINDAFIDYQACSDNCSLYGNGLKIDTAFKALLNNAALFGQSPGGTNTATGDSNKQSAPSCSFLKMIESRGIDGFYWIQNKCATKPAKVYCTLTQSVPKGLIIENDHDYKLANIREVKSIKLKQDFLQICSRKGLQIAKITSAQEIETVMLLSVLYGFTFHSKYAIILGMDQGCAMGKCTGKWHSMDGSTDLNQAAAQFNSKIGKGFNMIKGNDALVMQDGFLKVLPLDKVHVSSAVCETQNEAMLRNTKCEETFNDLQEDIVYIMFVCPNDCKPMPVFGNAIYSQNSYICSAMKHSGNFSEMSSDYIVSYGMTQNKLLKSFEGGVNNNIESKPRDKQGYGYAFISLADECPSKIVEDLIDGKNSFIQLGVNDTFKELNHNQRKDLFKKIAMSKSFLQMKSNLHISKIDPNSIDIEGENMSYNDEYPNQYNSRYNYQNKYNQMQPVNNNTIQQAQPYYYPQYSSIVPQVAPIPLNNQYLSPNPNYVVSNPPMQNQMIQNPYYLNNYQPANYINQFKRNKGNISNYITWKNNHTHTPPNLSGLEDSYNSRKFNQVLYNIQDSDVLTANKNTFMDINQNYHAMRSYSNLKKANHQYNIPGNNMFKNSSSFTNPLRSTNKLDLIYYKNGFKLIPIRYHESNMFDTTYTDDILDKRSRNEIKKNIEVINKAEEYENHLYSQSFMDSNPELFDQLAKKHINSSTANPKIMEEWKKYSGEISAHEDPNDLTVEKELEDYDNKIKNEKNDQIKPYEDKLDLNIFKSNVKKESTQFKQLDIDLTEQDEWKVTYKDYMKVDGKPIDLRSDKERQKNYYNSNYKNLEDMEHYIFWTEDGDKTTLVNQRLEIITGGPLDIALTYERKFKEKIKLVQDKLDQDLKELNSHRPYVNPELKVYEEMALYSDMVLRVANWEINFYKQMIFRFEDSIQFIFQYVSISYVANDSGPLPYYWQVINPTYSNESEKGSLFQLPAPDTILLQTDPISEKNDYGVILVTRYHRTFDGSFHFTFKLPQPLNSGTPPIMGALIRYADQFNHYSFKLIPAEKKLIFTRVSSEFYRVMDIKILPNLNLSTNLRMVIKFTKFIFKVWLLDDEGEISYELDKDERKKEFEILNNDYPILLYDTFFKEGRVGYYCNNCKGTQFKGAKLFADRCIVEDKTKGYDTLISLYTCRFKESYKNTVGNKFNQYETYGKAKWSFKQTKGKMMAVECLKPTNDAGLKDQPSSMLAYKDRSKICFNNCRFKASIRKVKGKVGNISIMFKFRSPKDYYAINFRVNETKKSVRWAVIEMKAGALDKWLGGTMPPSFDINQWQLIDLGIVNQFLYVVVNKTQLLVNALEIEGMDTVSGTYGIGINTIRVEFSDMQIKLMDLDAFANLLNRKNKSLKVKELSDLVHESKKPEEVVREELIMWGYCVAQKTVSLRTSFCDLIIGTANLNGCIKDFAAICCDMYAGTADYSTCVEETDKSVAKVEMKEDYFATCFIFKSDMNITERQFACKACCQEKKSPFINESDILKCESKCSSVFSYTPKFGVVSFLHPSMYDVDPDES